MLRSILLDIWPYAISLCVVLGAMATLIRKISPRVTWRSLARLHADEGGGVQSLSFVLTVPFFIILMLLAVQITQLMIGLMVVQYAAFAAARAATVWIPAYVSVEEPANCISNVSFNQTVANGSEYVVATTNTGKFEKIRTAAALACVPIAPSRDLGGPATGDAISGSLVNVYGALAPSSASNSRLPQRLTNKWAYANQHTQIGIKIFHRADEPPLVNHDLPPYREEFMPNEIGYRDKIEVTVSHRFALLPGPGRLLGPPDPPAPNPTPKKVYIPPNQRMKRGRPNQGSPGVVAPTPPAPPKVKRLGNLYYTLLTATATLGNEGEKPLVTYVQWNP